MSRSKHPTVFVVDDDPAVRKAIRLILESGDYHVESFESATAFLEQFDPARPGCLISDVRMPGMDGMQLLQKLEKLQMRMPVLMLSAHGDIRMAVKAIRHGARDFLEKPIDPGELREKVGKALAQDALALNHQAENDEIRQCCQTLTPREREVLDFIVSGKNTKLIALALGTAHNTVRVQRANVMRKMKADNVSDLVRMMHRIGALDD